MVHSVAFSPDGAKIVSGSIDKTLRLWNATTGESIGKSLYGHEHWISSVAFIPNGEKIVSGSYDGTIRLWDATTGKSIGTPLEGHENIVYSVAFSRDGKTIASGGLDGTVRLWDITDIEHVDISQEELLQRACNQFRWHPSFIGPETNIEEEAKRICDRYVFSKEENSP